MANKGLSATDRKQGLALTETLEVAHRQYLEWRQTQKSLFRAFFHQQRAEAIQAAAPVDAARAALIDWCHKLRDDDRYESLESQLKDLTEIAEEMSVEELDGDEIPDGDELDDFLNETIGGRTSSDADEFRDGVDDTGLF